MFNFLPQEKLDSQNMTVEDVSRAIRRRFPFTGRLEFVRQSANLTFKSKRYIFKVPITPAARNFSSFEAEVVNSLPTDSKVIFPRIKFSDVSLPISRYRIISGRPLIEFTSNNVLPSRKLPHVLGRAIALLHSCHFQGELRKILEQQRIDFYTRVQKQLERQIRIRERSDRSLNEYLPFLDNILSNHLNDVNFVFCHGDIRSGNIIVSLASDETVGIIDFGNACYNLRESDFAAIRQVDFRNEVAKAYEKHSGYTLDAKLLEKFTALRNVLRDAKARKNASARKGDRS